MPSLEEAIDQKYGGDLFDCNLSSITIYVPKKNPRNIIPSLLVLNDCDIDTAGTKELATKCEDVRELDLAQNKLKEWREVIEILRCMPQLNFVNLSFNDLSQELTDYQTCYPHMKNLVLNSTYVTWDTVRKLLKSLPSLEELHLSFNDFHNVDLCQNCIKERKEVKIIHNCVKKLHFTGNPITTWREVMKLGESFPSLESLVLAECPIKSLDPHHEETPPVSVQLQNGNCSDHTAACSLEVTSDRSTSYSRTESECEANQNKESSHHWFRFLKFLNLNYTLLESWDDVDRLGRFPALICLRIQGCPLFETSQYTEHERRQLLIARLGNVQTLNGGGIISNEEREDAERAFIRYYMEKPESDRPERYNDLVGIHGKLDPLTQEKIEEEQKKRRAGERV